jgi:hypothetical protein
LSYIVVNSLGEVWRHEDDGTETCLPEEDFPGGSPEEHTLWYKAAVQKSLEQEELIAYCKWIEVDKICEDRDPSVIRAYMNTKLEVNVTLSTEVLEAVDNTFFWRSVAEFAKSINGRLHLMCEEFNESCAYKTGTQEIVQYDENFGFVERQVEIYVDVRYKSLGQINGLADKMLEFQRMERKAVSVI